MRFLQMMYVGILGLGLLAWARPAAALHAWCPTDAPAEAADGYRKYIVDDGFTSDDVISVMHELAPATCGALSKELNGYLVKLRKAFKAKYRATEAQFIDVMALLADRKRRAEAYHTQCQGYWPDDRQSLAFAKLQAIAQVMGCQGSPDLAQLDTPNPTMIERVALLRRCDDKLNHDFVYCLEDAKALDEHQYFAEVNALQPNVYGRGKATIHFLMLRAALAQNLRAAQTSAKQDPIWKLLLDSHRTAWAAWHQHQRDHAATLARVAALRADTQNAKTCRGELLGLLFTHVGAVELTSQLAVVRRATDDIGMHIVLALLACAARTDDRVLGYAMQDVLGSPQPRFMFGPRAYAYFQVLAATEALPYATREQVRLGWPPSADERREIKAALGNTRFDDAPHDNRSPAYGRIREKIAKVTPGTDGVTVEFEPHKLSVDECSKFTFKNLEERHKCHRSEVPVPAVFVETVFASGLKPGWYIELLLDKKAKRAIPLTLSISDNGYRDRGYLGIVW